MDRIPSSTNTIVSTPPPPLQVSAAKGSPTAARTAAAKEERRTDLDSILAGESQPIVAGTLMGEYEVTVKLGEGGMGEVYAAVHPLIGKKVAIKVLSDAVAANREVVRRFVDEARAVNQIGHSNIVDVFSFGQHSDGRHFYVMEHLEGCSLEDEVSERGTLPADEIVDIVVQTLDALEAAHEKGIIHRDLKPDNIFLTRDSRGRGIKLLDFGIAKLSGEESRSRTQTGMALGTPDYMSPEQCRGSQIDRRTDIYAVGVMLYRMFTGHFPFEGITHVLELFMKVASEAPIKPSAHVPLPEAFEAVILKCMEKEPSDRFSTATELSEALVAALAEPGALVTSELGEVAEPASSLFEGATADMTQGGGDTGEPPSGTSEQVVAAAVSPTAVEQGLVSERADVVEATPPPDAEKNRSRLVPILGASVVALGAAGFFVWQGASSDSKRTDAPIPKVAVAPKPDAAAVVLTPPPPSPADAAPTVPDAGAAKATTGGLLVTTGNARAEVRIDGESFGKGKKVEVATLSAGVHVLTVRAPKHQEQTLQITIVAGEVATQRISLKRAAKVVVDKKPDEKPPVDDKPPPLIKDRDKTLGWDP